MQNNIIEKMRKTLLRRIHICGYIFILTGCAAVLQIADMVADIFPANHHPDYLNAIMLGVLLLVAALTFVYVFKYTRIRQNETACKELYIKENDERVRAINEKAGFVGFRITTAGLLIGATVFGHLAVAVFYALVGAAAFGTAVKFVLYIYYSKKLNE
jgi:uncharacterized membrane protein